MEVLSLSNITKVFKNHTAVDSLTFSLTENRVVGFLGPNGAGKTTTLRMIVGLSKPTSGEIKLFGRSAAFGDSTIRKDIGYLPEQPALYSWMTGVEYLSFFADIYQIVGDKKLKRIDELLELVSLTDARKRKIGTYSNGMKQRIGIAQALLNNPKLVVMDEPVSALDPIGRKEVLKTIETIKESSTVLFSTHILSDVDRICDDVVILNKGKLVTSSPLVELKKKHAAKILTVEFTGNPKSKLTDLKQQSWVTRFEMNERIIRIWLKDESVITNNMPLTYLLSKGLGIVKYDLQVPEIEDLFIDLLSEEHE